MNETVKKIQQAFRDKPELRKQYEEELGRLAEGKPNEEAVVKAIKNVLGMEITLADLEKSNAAEEVLDLDELEEVAGGEENNWCWKDYRCVYIYEDPPDESNSENS